jgi:hypothetical protein
VNIFSNPFFGYSVFPRYTPPKTQTLTISSNLTPGGFIELADICFPVQAIDDSLRNDSQLRKWSDLLLEATQKAGRPMDSARYYQAQLEAAGFIKVEKIQYKWPQNPWPKDKDNKILGTRAPPQMLLSSGLQAWSFSLGCDQAHNRKC